MTGHEQGREEVRGLAQPASIPAPIGDPVAHQARKPITFGDTGPIHAAGV
jgi:hypothetical protein